MAAGSGASGVGDLAERHDEHLTEAEQPAAADALPASERDVAPRWST